MLNKPTSTLSPLLKASSILRERGPFGLGRWVLDSITWEVKKLNPRFRARLWEHVNFDNLHNVDTFSSVLLDQLDIDPKSLDQAYWYEAAEPWIIRDIIANAPIEPERATLVDLGAGKGRVLLMAAAHTFRAIVGVELSLPLVKIATQNIAQFKSAIGEATKVDLTKIKILHDDAVNFHFPPGDLLITLFNPFGPVILEKVLTNLCAHSKEAPRKIVVAYVNPLHRDVFTKNDKWTRIRTHPRYEMYVRNAG